jgi:hypothetical protein
MRVELVYAPGCNLLGLARNNLEMVIAEERLPIPVELVEDHNHGISPPSVRIDGICHVGHHFDHLRDLLSGRWKELNEHQLLGV